MRPWEAKLIGLFNLRMLLPSTSTSVAVDLTGDETACRARLESMQVESCKLSIGIQSGPLIGVQKGPLWRDGSWPESA
jgi:hypothetical protein